MSTLYKDWAYSRVKTYFVFLLVLIFGVILIAAHEVFQPPPDPGFLTTSLNQLQAKSLDTIVEMNKLIISLALLVIAGGGGLLLRGDSKGGMSQKIVLLLSLLFAASSIFSGYVLYDNLIVMLSNDFYNPANTLIKWPQRIQFYSFFFSIVLFAIFAITGMLHHQHGRDADQ
jgi:hypothetical protein